MTRIAKHAATALRTGFLAVAAGAVLLLAGTQHTGTPIHISLTPPATVSATTHIVPCNSYLSHAAMVVAQVDGIGPAPTPSFCAAS